MGASSKNTDVPEQRIDKSETTLEAGSIKAKSDTDFLKSAQSVLTFALGLTAFLTAIGFIIVNSYLAQYTDIHGYSVHPGQYIAAAIGAIVFSSLIILSLSILLLIFTLVVGVVVSIFVVPLMSTLNKTVSPKISSWGALRFFFSGAYWKVFIRIVSESMTKTRKRLLTGAVILIIILASAAYGVSVYGLIPRYLGGGAPVEVYIVLADNEPISAFRLSTVDSYPNIISNVQILAELNNGLLIYDPNNILSAIIDNNEIKAIFDADALFQGASR